MVIHTNLGQRERDASLFWAYQNTNLLPLKIEFRLWSNSSAFGQSKEQLAASTGNKRGQMGVTPLVH